MLDSVKEHIKELSLCRKLKISNFYFFTTFRVKPLIFQGRGRGENKFTWKLLTEDPKYSDQERMKDLGDQDQGRVENQGVSGNMEGKGGAGVYYIDEGKEKGSGEGVDQGVTGTRYEDPVSLEDEDQGQTYYMDEGEVKQGEDGPGVNTYQGQGTPVEGAAEQGASYFIKTEVEEIQAGGNADKETYYVVNNGAPADNSYYLNAAEVTKTESEPTVFKDAYSPILGISSGVVLDQVSELESSHSAEWAGIVKLSLENEGDTVYGTDELTGGENGVEEDALDGEYGLEVNSNHMALFSGHILL